MHITTYDAQDNYEQRDLKVTNFDYSIIDIYNSSQTSYSAGGYEWTKSKSTSGGFSYLTFTTDSAASLNQLSSLLVQLGFDINNYSTYTLDEYFEEYPDNNRPFLVKDDDPQADQYPCYRFAIDTIGAQDNYTIWLNYGQNSYATRQVSPDAYTSGFLQPITVTRDDWSFFGLMSYKIVDYGATATTEISIIYNQQIDTRNYVEVEIDPGNKGFRPIKDTNMKNRGGGYKSGQKPTYQSDALSQPGAPDESSASIIGSGYVNLYKIDKANLANVGKCLFSTTFWTFFQGIGKDPLSALISLNVFPCAPSVGASEFVKLLKYVCNTTDLGANATAAKLSSQYKVVDFGSVNVGEMFESYLDYESTTFSLYLPFIGEVDLPVSEVMGGSVNVQYTIDFCTGACTANVLCSKTIALDGISVDTQYSQHSYQGNCACQIPISSVNYGNLVGNIITAAATGLSGNVVGAGVGLMEAGVSGGLAPAVKTKGNITANGGFCAVLFPYLTIIRPITAEPENFQEVNGYPSYMDSTLSTCSGLCICDNINLSGLTGATDSEIERIKQICKEGIYI